MDDFLTENNFIELGSFQYYKKFDNCAEYEIDHVFLLTVDTEIAPILYNLDEISDLKWISLKSIDEGLKKTPNDFTFWFPLAYEFVKEHIGDEFFKMCSSLY